MVAGFEENLKANLPFGSLEELLNDAIKYKKELQTLVTSKLLTGSGCTQ
jgi:hypothetical protein